MTWLFLILILSTLAVVCVGIAIYLRVRRHMKSEDQPPADALNDMEQGRETSNF
jgi:hypothetical protein